MTETWKPCPGYEGIYCVSDHGRVMRVAAGKGTRIGRVLKLSTDNNGYPFVNLTRDRKSFPRKVHRLVCEAFNGPPPTPKHEAAHRDGNPSNNLSGNLRWSTHRENMADKVRHGTHNAGSANPRARLNENAAREIKSLLADGMMQRVIAARYAVARTTINNIAIGKNWRHV